MDKCGVQSSNEYVDPLPPPSPPPPILPPCFSVTSTISVDTNKFQMYLDTDMGTASLKVSR